MFERIGRRRRVGGGREEKERRKGDLSFARFGSGSSLRKAVYFLLRGAEERGFSTSSRVTMAEMKARFANEREVFTHSAVL